MNTEIFNRMCRGNFNDRLFAFMNLVGLDSIRVNYSGGGDSGGVDNIEYAPDKISKSIKDQITESCEEEMASPIYNRHGSFADGGGYSVDGTVIYNAKNKTVSICGTDHYYEWESNGEDDEDDGEETSRDEEWDETIYSQDEHDLNSNEDYAFVTMYAKCVLKGKLPEEFHNRVLFAAADGDEDAIEYVNNLRSNKK